MVEKGVSGAKVVCWTQDCLKLEKDTNMDAKEEDRG